RVDRLEVDLAREEEVAVVELGVLGERLAQRDADGVLDEARLEVRVLDDKGLVGPLQELVDRPAHRALGGLAASLRVRREVGGSAVPRRRGARPRWLGVARGPSPWTRSRAPPPKPASRSRSAALPRTRPCAHGHALMPTAATPTSRRDSSRDDAAMPISET